MIPQKSFIHGPWMVGLLILMGACLAALFGIKIHDSIYDDRNWERLLNTFVLARGFPLYHGPDSGPVLITIYGPVSILAYLPAVLAPTPTSAMRVAEAVLMCFYFLPPFWIHLKLSPSEAGFRVRLWLFFVFCFFAFICKPLRDAAFNVHVDGPTLGLAAAACIFLLRKAFFLSAILAVLSVWSKQVAVPLLIAMPLYLYWIEGKKAAAKYTFYLLICGGLVSVFFLWVFDPGRLFFNILFIPSRHGFRGDSAWALWTSTYRFLGEIAVVLILAAISWVPFLWRCRNFKEGVRSSPAVLFLIVGILMAPTALLSNAKIGGSTNTFSYSAYFILLAATAGFIVQTEKRASRYFLIALSLFFLCLQIPSAALAFFSPPKPNYAEMVFSYIQKHSGEVYFPRLTLLHLWAENKVYHASGGLMDRSWAKLPLAPEHLRAHLPARMKMFAFRKGAASDREWLDLPEYRYRTKDPALPGFRLYKNSSKFLFDGAALEDYPKARREAPSP